MWIYHFYFLYNMAYNLFQSCILALHWGPSAVIQQVKPALAMPASHTRVPVQGLAAPLLILLTHLKRQHMMAQMPGSLLPTQNGAPGSSLQPVPHLVVPSHLETWKGRWRLLPPSLLLSFSLFHSLFTHGLSPFFILPFKYINQYFKKITVFEIISAYIWFFSTDLNIFNLKNECKCYEN